MTAALLCCLSSAGAAQPAPSFTPEQQAQIGRIAGDYLLAHPETENVIVLKDMPDVAQHYLTHWQSRWDLGADWFPAQ